MTSEIIIPRLGVNVDHVATVRNARGGTYPCPVRAAQLAMEAGADGITAHLREDRRHIVDHDIERLKSEVDLPLNMEMAATSEMLEIALRVKPHACCIVPEKREELTTEGGLNVHSGLNHLTPFVSDLKEAGIRVSLFIDARSEQIEASAQAGADIVELHTGAYCDFITEGNEAAAQEELDNIIAGAHMADRLGLEVHAGHGLTFETVGPITAIPQFKELNIGHFLVGEAIFLGLDGAIKQMRSLMKEARS